MTSVDAEVIYESETHNGVGELLEILGSIINGHADPNWRAEYGNGIVNICDYNRYPWSPKDYCLNAFCIKTIVLIRIYNQQFQGTILLMVFDFQGICL